MEIFRGHLPLAYVVQKGSILMGVYLDEGDPLEIDYIDESFCCRGQCIGWWEEFL